MRHHRSSKSSRHRTFTEFVVVDIAGNPIAHFGDDEARSKQFVEEDAKGRRIIQINLNSMVTIINNEAYNVKADRPDGAPWD